MSRRRPRRLGVAACLAVAVAVGTLPATAAHAAPGTDLVSARAQAERLRDRLDLLSARQDRAAEHLAHTQDLLAEAALRSTLAEEQLAGLDAGRDSLADDAAARVREAYRLGGPLGIYGSLLSAETPGEVATRYATLDAVLSLDVVTVAAADLAVSQASRLHAELDRLAQRRAFLVGQARLLADELTALEASTETALRRSNARVRQIASRLADQRAQAAASAAAADLAALGLTGNEAPGSPYGAAAVAAALSVLGSPYVWGDEGPDTFDCSGLVQWSYQRAGLVLPRLASEQYFASTPVPVSDLRPGDLLVYAYDTDDRSTIHHITMYIGNGQMVHAPHTGDVVRVVPVYLTGLYGVGRPGVRER
ncbi:MAG: C40 family peptidase [Actinomycetota bacterium]|nr:C40 family peptidase [Actinomycetota bacterium]